MKKSAYYFGNLRKITFTGITIIHQIFVIYHKVKYKPIGKIIILLVHCMLIVCRMYHLALIFYHCLKENVIS